MFEIAEIKLQRQIRASHATWHRNYAAAQLLPRINIGIEHWALGVGLWAFSDHDWSVAIAHARATRQERVFVRDVGVGMNGNGRDMQLAASCAFVQGLDILQAMLETIPAQIDLIFRDRIKHERVVRIRGMSEGKDFRRTPHRRMLSVGGNRRNIRAFLIAVCVIWALPIASPTWRRWRRPVSARV